MNQRRNKEQARPGGGVRITAQTKEPRLKGTWYCKERMKFRVGGSHGIEKLGCRDRQSHIMYNLIFIPTAMKINQNILSRGVL